MTRIPLLPLPDGNITLEDKIVGDQRGYYVSLNRDGIPALAITSGKIADWDAAR